MVHATSPSATSRPARDEMLPPRPAPLAVGIGGHDVDADGLRAYPPPAAEAWPSPTTPSLRSERPFSLSSSPTSSLPAGSPPGIPGLGPRATAAWAGVPASLLPPPAASPRGPDGLSHAEHVAIVGAFAAEVPRIFGDNLVYAFVCGSVARLHAIRTDDIDTFVVLRERHPAPLEAYTTWLTGLHGRAGLVVDPVYPHEVLSRRQLDAEVWPRLAGTHLDLDFNAMDTFDTVTWADMVAGPRWGTVFGADGERALARDAAVAAPHVARWRGELLERLGAPGPGTGRPEVAREGPPAGHLAERARAYLTGDTFARDFPDHPGGAEAFDWRLLAPLALSRLIKRVAPLPEQRPPPGTAPVAEALMSQPTLRTPRLVLRPLEEEDAPAIFDMCRRPEVAEHCSWEPMTSLSQAAAYIAGQRRAAAAGQATNWAVTHHEGSRVVGTIGLVDLDVDDGRATLGFAFHPDVWRRGLCTEAGRRLIGFLERLGVSKISADVVRGHYASQKVLLNLRMDPEGISRHHVKKHGIFHDLITYTRLSDGR